MTGRYPGVSTGRNADHKPVTVIGHPPIRLGKAGDSAGIDVSYLDIPYPVVPALSLRPLWHVAVRLHSVAFRRDPRDVDAVYVDLHCGKQLVLCDRRVGVASDVCRVCFRAGGLWALAQGVANE